MRSQRNTPAFFITATDTGVGKTTITAALIKALQQNGHHVGVMKPIETGVDPEQQEQSDTNRLRRLLSPSPSCETVCLYAFPEPLAPLACARKAGTPIEIPHILATAERLMPLYSLFLMEGAGGVFTPITTRHAMRELIVSLSIPVIVVGRTSLGSVNHLLLTLEALACAEITPCSIVLNDAVAPIPTPFGPDQRLTTVELIRELSTVPVFGPLEYEATLSIDWEQGVGILAGHPEIQRLRDYLIERQP